MGRQVNFFLHPNDQSDFNEFLKKFEDIIFIPQYNYSNKIRFSEDIIMRDHVKEGFQIFLARRKDLSEIKLKYIETQNYWLVDRDSPIIEFSRCIFREDSIQSGRLYFQPTIMKDRQWINHQEDFIKWSDKIIKATRRKLEKHKFIRNSYDYNTLLGNYALKWVNSTNAMIDASGHLIRLENKSYLKTSFEL